MEITARQADRLQRVHNELGTLLTELGIIDSTKLPVEPQWRRDTAKQWGMLNAVDQAGGDLGSEELARLGRQHGYDPRGLGGFFRGHGQLLARQGERRVLTEHGRRFIERWRVDFDASGK